MIRKLASVQRVKELLPIAGADRIELCLVLGWQVVVKKGEFEVGQLVYFLEIDSFVPSKIAPFLTSDGKSPKEYSGVMGERLRTVKLRKQLSQGLVLPIPENLKFTEGEDVTDYLGVLKWEAPEKADNSGTRQAKGAVTRAFPYFLRKTDQERIQNFGELAERALDEVFEATVKKDGSSVTVFRVDASSVYYKDAKKLYTAKLGFWQRIVALFKTDKAPVFGICSRNLLLPLQGESNFHTAAQPLLAALQAMPGGTSLAIQGEVVAPNIQDNHEEVSQVEVHVFDIFDIDKQEYLLCQDRRELAALYTIPHVSSLAVQTLRNIVNYTGDIVSNCLAYAEGPGDNPGVMREGVVFKSVKRDFSFKCISNSYLLKTGK